MSLLPLLAQVRTQHRFELMLSEPQIIGMRRAAQRMMGEAQKKLAAMGERPADVSALLGAELVAMTKA